jgi:signal peptidase I
MRNKKLLKLLIGLALVIILYFNPYKVIMVIGNSMYPSLKSHQLVLAKKVDKIERGDIVVAFNDARETIIKRVAYLPGECYQVILEPGFSEPKMIQDLNHPELIFFLVDSRCMVIDCKIPKGQYFLLGDNKNNSDDSRRFGTIEKKDIIYKVIYR